MEIEKESVSSTLKLRSNRVTENAIDQETSSKISSSTKEDIRALPQPTPDFNAIYNELHSKFPEIINLDKPVLLAVGIRKEMSQETGVSNMVLKRWIAWYFRKSKYYKLHDQGAIRYNLKGEEAGVVTEKHCEKMVKGLEKMKKPKTKANDDDAERLLTGDI